MFKRAKNGSPKSRITVLGAGVVHVKPSELLRSEHAQRLLESEQFTRLLETEQFMQLMDEQGTAAEATGKASNTPGSCGRVPAMKASNTPGSRGSAPAMKPSPPHTSP